MNEIDLSKLNKFYFFDDDENKELIEILQNHIYGEYIKIFDIEVTYNRFKFNTLWRLDDRFGQTIRRFDVIDDSDLFNKVYNFLIQKEISGRRNLQLRKIGI